MSQCGTPVGEMPPGAAVSRNNGKQEASYVDTLPHELEQQNPDRLITYAVEARNDSGRAAGLSNQVQIPLAPTLPPPPNYKAELTASGVALSWECEPPPSTADRVRYTYRIYRRSVDSGADVKLADVDCPDSRFVDDTFEWQKSYEYRITVVTSVNLGPLHACSTKGPAEQGFSDCVEVATVEGDDSPAQKIVTNDVFPPGVPSGLQAVFSGPGQRAFVDLVWAPDTDADLAGYKVYRREEGSQPAKINAELVKTPAFRDANVAAGKTYWYSVSAVDLRGNESTRSEESSEQVP